MWLYEKRLQYPINITKPNAKAAAVIIDQLGGPDGELGVGTLGYLSQTLYNAISRKFKRY